MIGFLNNYLFNCLLKIRSEPDRLKLSYFFTNNLKIRKELIF